MNRKQWFVKKETWRTIRTKHCFNWCVILSVPVRLIGAKIVYGGRIEVFYRRRWGKICRNKWDINGVKVVCKQLGFRGALAEFMTGMNTTEKKHTRCDVRYSLYWTGIRFSPM